MQSRRRLCCFRQSWIRPNNNPLKHLLQHYLSFDRVLSTEEEAIAVGGCSAVCLHQGRDRWLQGKPLKHPSMTQQISTRPYVNEHKLRLERQDAAPLGSRHSLSSHELDLLGDFKATGVVPPHFGGSRKPKVAAVGLKLQKDLPESAHSSIKIPSSMPQARASPEKDMWETALKTKLGSFVSNTVWELPDIPVDTIPKDLIINSRLVFDVPRNADGSIKKFKIRLCGRGDRWKDQWETPRYSAQSQCEWSEV